MLNFYLRRDLMVQLMHLEGTLRARDLHNLIEDVAVQDPDPPFGMVTFIDTRAVTSYDTTFVGALALSARVGSVYGAVGHRFVGHILAGEAWKFGMANMFAAASRMIDNFDLRIFEDEQELVAAHFPGGGLLHDHFGPATLYYTTGEQD